MAVSLYSQPTTKYILVINPPVLLPSTYDLGKNKASGPLINCRSAFPFPGGGPNLKPVAARDKQQGLYYPCTSQEKFVHIDVLAAED